MIEHSIAEASEEFAFPVLSPLTLAAMSRIHEAQSYGRDSLDIATLTSATTPIGSVTDDIPKLSTPEAMCGGVFADPKINWNKICNSLQHRNNRR